MNNDMRDFLEKTIKQMSQIDYVKPEEIPNIDLYMDQVTTFMNSTLASSRRHDSDKLLTKTMINNYAKNSLLPPPVKKKYSKEHLLTLVFIYYLKNILSISDIHSIITPLTERYFGSTDGPNMTDIYNEVFSLESNESEKLLKDLAKKYSIAMETFQDFPEEDQEFLHRFSLICMLSYDVYLKKMIIEHLIDDMNKTE